MRRQRGAGQAFTIRMLGGEWATAMTCAEAGCQAYEKGWWTVLDVRREDMAWMATFIKERSGRRFYEFTGANALDGAYDLQARGWLVVEEPLRAMLAAVAPEMVVFCFPAGQTCFRQHLDREVKFNHLTRAGNYEHTRPLDFNEDMNETADKIGVLRQRG